MENSNWRNTCRACLVTRESFTYHLFDNVSPENYWFCTSIEVHDDEKLPRAICDVCFELLNRLYNFKSTCIESQNKLNCTITETFLVGQHELNKVSDDTHPLDINIIKEEDQYNEDVLYQDDFCEDESIKKPAKIIESKLNPEIRVSKRFCFSCDQCTKKFSYFKRFEAHKLEHEGKVIPIHCFPCNKTFKKWASLKRHNDVEHTTVNLQSLRCSVCGRICKSQQTLQLHKKMHEHHTQCVCHICGKSFKTPTNLKTHMETHQENRERRHPCDQCGKKFFSTNTLKSHISRRHRGKRYICQICSYPFTDKFSLVKHFLKHEGKKLYKCDICSKSYATKSTLVEHKRAHSGERPYECSYCAKCFVSRRMMNDHHKIHTGERPHKCNVCEQAFTQRGTLRRHMKIHERNVVGIN